MARGAPSEARGAAVVSRRMDRARGELASLSESRRKAHPSGLQSSEQMVVLRVVADPIPHDLVPIQHANGPVVNSDSGGIYRPHGMNPRKV